jgi:hypothetical protein
VEADFTGGHLSSDGGVLLLREMDRHMGLCDKLARCFADARHPGFIEHALPVMIRQRVLGLALGYEDLNDHDQLRTDPLLAAACGNPDLLGEGRRHQQDQGKALAGKSTLNRLELGAARSGGKYRKINADAQAIATLLLDEGVRAMPPPANWRGPKVVKSPTPFVASPSSNTALRKAGAARDVSSAKPKSRATKTTPASSSPT